MCDEKDAKRYETLAKLQEDLKEFENARMSYLEASSIYLLQSELQKNIYLLEKSNLCYKKSRLVVGKIWYGPLNKQELAKRTLIELNENQNKKDMLALIEQELE